MGMPESDDESLATTQDGGSGIDDLLASQIDYYRAHAPRYDDWWRRTGQHDLGEDYRLRWESEIAELDATLAAFAPLGDVLEFAGELVTGRPSSSRSRSPSPSSTLRPKLSPSPKTK